MMPGKLHKLVISNVEYFDFVYRGYTEIDRHYTGSMLSWIISEIKNQHQNTHVSNSYADCGLKQGIPRTEGRGVCEYAIVLG